MPPLKGYLTSDAAAHHLGIARQTFDNQARTADFPTPRRIGRTPLWRITELDTWRARHPARRKAPPRSDGPRHVPPRGDPE